MVTVVFVVNEWPCQFPIQLPPHFHYDGGMGCAVPKSRAPLCSVPAVSARYERFTYIPGMYLIQLRCTIEGLDITPKGLCNQHDLQ